MWHGDTALLTQTKCFLLSSSLILFAALLYWNTEEGRSNMYVCVSVCISVCFTPGADPWFGGHVDTTGRTGRDHRVHCSAPGSEGARHQRRRLHNLHYRCTAKAHADAHAVDILFVFKVLQRIIAGIFWSDKCFVFLCSAFSFYTSHRDRSTITGHEVRQEFVSALSLGSIVSGALHPIRLHLQGGCLQSLMCPECKWMPDLSLETRLT